jgi:prevent-host-death family protein
VTYATGVDVAISELRANLRAFVERAQAGEDIVVTERGVPVARLSPIPSADALERLTREGLVSRPSASRPSARGHRRVPSDSSVSDMVGELRR